MKMIFGGAFFGTVCCGIAGDSWGFALGPPPGPCLGPTEGLITPSRPPAAPGNDLHCLSCVLQDTTFIYALATNLAHHSKFLKKGL